MVASTNKLSEQNKIKDRMESSWFLNYYYFFIYLMVLGIDCFTIELHPQLA
jgi:hypothetical protein